MEWFPPYYDGGSKLIGYTLEVKETEATDWKVVTTTLETYSTIRNLKEGVKYDFRVTAENAVGKSKALYSEKPVIPVRQFGMFVSFLFFSDLIYMNIFT